MSNQLDSLEAQKVKTVIRSYFKWFLGLVFLAVIAVFTAYLFNKCLLPFIWVMWLQIFALIIEATALGQCGYNIQILFTALL